MTHKSNSTIHILNSPHEIKSKFDIESIMKGIDSKRVKRESRLPKHPISPATPDRSPIQPQPNIELRKIVIDPTPHMQLNTDQAKYMSDINAFQNRIIHLENKLAEKVQSVPHTPVKKIREPISEPYNYTDDILQHLKCTKILESRNESLTKKITVYNDKQENLVMLANSQSLMINSLTSSFKLLEKRYRANLVQLELVLSTKDIKTVVSQFITKQKLSNDIIVKLEDEVESLYKNAKDWSRYF